jgi:hypothetical protein
MSEPVDRQAIKVFIGKIKLESASEISDFLFDLISAQCRYRSCQPVKVLCCVHLCLILKKENQSAYRFSYRMESTQAFLKNPGFKKTLIMQTSTAKFFCYFPQGLITYPYGNRKAQLSSAATAYRSKAIAETRQQQTAGAEPFRRLHNR